VAGKRGKPYLARFNRLFHSFHCAAGGKNRIALCWRTNSMKLININIIRSKPFKTQVHVFKERWFIIGGWFWSDYNIFPLYSLYCVSYFFFAVGIAMGGINKVNPHVYRLAYNIRRVSLWQTHNGNAAKSNLAYHEPGFSESSHFHGMPPLKII